MIEFLIGTIFVLIWLVIVPLVIYLFLMTRNYQRVAVRIKRTETKKNGGEGKDGRQNKRKTAKKTQIGHS